MGETTNPAIPADADPRALPFLRIVADPQAGAAARLAALRGHEAVLGRSAKPGAGEINNHIHTIYSFSPYTPSMAAFRARASGLIVAGSVDHDSVAAAGEMLDACAILGIGGTVGFEIRVSLLDSPFADRKINNPDSRGLIYMTLQGLPRPALGLAAEFLRPIALARGRRNLATSAAISGLLAASGYEPIDYARDVLPLSMAMEGGSVTERHILAAAAHSIIRRHGRGPALVAGLATALGIEAPPRVASWLSDADNPNYVYDLLGLLKSGFLDRVFVQPGKAECIPAREALAFARKVGAIPCYAYLGDIADSPTGDKKAEKFEDDFLDELLPWLAKEGFQAVTYMPPRNSKAQLARLRALCEGLGLMEISGVDINSPRQGFNCPEVLDPAMARLVDTTWALVAHERLASYDPRLGLFAEENPLAGRSLPDRIDLYAAAGRALDRSRPDDPAELARLSAAWR